jgi:hypothetical protein|tara:strand:- start:1340 stop:1606 length:267 start_codon:yes stop_codon:yes gene_type:complete
MIKKFTLIFIISIIIFFFYVILNNYFSDLNKSKINKNRKNTYQRIQIDNMNLPVLKNDTNSAIEFNINNSNNSNEKSKRNFWNLMRPQ